MEDRSAEILDGLVENYIATGKPVGSLTLADILDLGVSPATIRAILQELDEAGYVYQPHTSAGRIPTDLGYRHYVDNVEGRSVPANQQEHIRGQFTELQKEYLHVARTASKLLSKLAHVVAVCSDVASRDIQEAGLGELMNQPEARNVETIHEISRILDEADRYVDNLAAKAADISQIFIGQEIPFFPAEHTSLVVRKIDLGDNRSVVLLLVGPKRMDYHRNVSLLNALTNIIEDNYDSRF